MKKIFFIFILMILSITNVCAFENEYFKIDIPDNYDIETNDNENIIYKWNNESDYLIITVDFNDNKYSIKDYTDNDILNQKKYLEDNINSALEDYKVNIVVSSIFKTKIKEEYSLQYDLYWPTKEITGEDTYQRGNVFTTGKYIITYLYSSNNEIKDDNEIYLKTINSLEMKDKSEVKKNLTINFGFIIIVGVILAIVNYLFLLTKKLLNK